MYLRLPLIVLTTQLLFIHSVAAFPVNFGLASVNVKSLQKSQILQVQSRLPTYRAPVYRPPVYRPRPNNFNNRPRNNFNQQYRNNQQQLRQRQIQRSQNRARHQQRIAAQRQRAIQQRQQALQRIQQRNNQQIELRRQRALAVQRQNRNRLNEQRNRNDAEYAANTALLFNNNQHSDALSNRLRSLALGAAANAYILEDRPQNSPEVGASLREIETAGNLATSDSPDSSTIDNTLPKRLNLSLREKLRQLELD